MITLITIVHVLVSLFLVLVILLQAGRGGGLSGLAGGSSSAFGGRGSQTFLGKVTTASAAIFMLTSLSLAFFSVEDESIVPRDLQAPGQVEPAEDSPVEPEGVRQDTGIGIELPEDDAPVIEDWDQGQPTEGDEEE